MNPQTLHNITSQNKEMPGDVFDALIENAKLSILNENEFEYRGKHNNYEIGFALINGILDVDVFGFNHKSDWVELEPTNGQYSTMLAKLNNTVIEKEYVPYLYKDPYHDNGVSRSDFY